MRTVTSVGDATHRGRRGRTAAVCVMEYTCAPDDTSVMRMVLSSLPDATSVPSGEMAHAYTYNRATTNMSANPQGRRRKDTHITAVHFERLFVCERHRRRLLRHDDRQPTAEKDATTTTVDPRPVTRGKMKTPRNSERVERERSVCHKMRKDKNVCCMKKVFLFAKPYGHVVAMGMAKIDW